MEDPLPIAPQFRHLYLTKEWKDKRSAALERADNKCERCKVPNHTAVERRMVRTAADGCRAWWRVGNYDASTATVYCLEWHDESGAISQAPIEFTRQWVLFVSLTVAHVDHNPENMDDANLQVLCCRCHIMHDRQVHAVNSRLTRQTRKDRRRPLLALLA